MFMYLSLKLSLNLLEFLQVLVPQGKVLSSHPPDQQLDILGLLLKHLDVIIVFLLQLLSELLNEPFLSIDNFFERRLLLLDGLVELLTFLFLFEL